MGCGSSNSSQQPAEPEQKQRTSSIKTSSTSEIEDLIGKKIPKVQNKITNNQLLMQPESKHKQTIDNEE